MSLRLRLTISSALVLLVLFATFGTGSYFILQKSLYEPVDTDIRTQVAANLHYLSKFGTFVGGTGTGLRGQFGGVTITYYFTTGQPYTDPYVSVNDYMFTKALGGQTVWGYASLPDGSRARVNYAPVIVTLTDNTQHVNGILIAASSLKLADSVMSNVLLLVASVTAVLLVVGTLGSYVLAARALRVVNKVTSKAQEIQTSQDLSRRIPEPKTDDEIGNLSKTFNGMLARLDEAFKAQRQFVADSSHELRTPLTVIKGNLHLLKRTTDAKEREELIMITEGEISRLNRMVNDLLYMAQIQAGHDLMPIMRTVELDSLLLDVFALGRSMAALKDQKMVLTHEDIASTYGDRDQLQHLLLNLVDNAVKYTPQHGTITLGLWASGKWARIEVTDSGPGIQAEDMPRLFDRFFRSQDARRNEHDGAGLGLAIVKSIAEAHEGTIEVISNPGEGSTFRIWLPLAQQPAAQVPETEAWRPAGAQPLAAGMEAE